MIKNRLISSLRTSITTLLIALSNIVALFSRLYQFRFYNWTMVQCNHYCNSISNCKCITLANNQTIFNENHHFYIWNRIAFCKLPNFLYHILFHSRSFNRNLRCITSSNCNGNSYNIHNKHYKHQLL